MLYKVSNKVPTGQSHATTRLDANKQRLKNLKLKLMSTYLFVKPSAAVRNRTKNIRTPMATPMNKP